MKIKFCVAFMAIMSATSVFAENGHDDPKSAASVEAYTRDQTEKSLSSLDAVKAEVPGAEKTRGQVRQELIESERAGLVPVGRTDYPPSQATINRNRVRFSLAEKYWTRQQ
ncbi:DUF4148 domain-containing protein [Trinickia mobilis]|uniref:DUF4148 domain-containing protein n=1 Tax=Trinickia mobilis TaxID=2816356 RepID=UPI001A8ED11A|nr:DUF4148 domain-containing protein [Trinickia mobilis]